jgi:hypothetical protein
MLSAEFRHGLSELRIAGQRLGNGPSPARSRQSQCSGPGEDAVVARAQRVLPRGEASTSLHNRTSIRRSERLRPGDSSRSWPPITDRDLRAGTDRSRYVIGPGLERRAQSGQVRRWSSALRRPGPFIIGRTGRPGSGLRSVFLTGRWPAADPVRVVVISMSGPASCLVRFVVPGCLALRPLVRSPRRAALPSRGVPVPGAAPSLQPRPERPAGRGPVHAIASPSWLVGQGSGAALVPGSLPPRPR